MSQPSSSVMILGASGACGSAMLNYSLDSKKYGTVLAFVREMPSNVPSNVSMFVDSDVTKWTAKFTKVDVVLSALGTVTSSASASEVAQGNGDLDLNIQLAKEAKGKGATTFVVVIPYSDQQRSCIPFTQKQSELEKSLEQIGFDTLIVLKPGPIMGESSTSSSASSDTIGLAQLSQLTQLAQPVVNWVSEKLYRTPLQRLARYPIQGDELGKAAVSYANRLSKGVYTFTGSQILEEVNPDQKAQSVPLSIRS